MDFVNLAALNPLWLALVIYGLTLLATSWLMQEGVAKMPMRYVTLLVPAIVAVLALVHLHDDMHANTLCPPLWFMAAMGMLSAGFIAGFFFQQNRFEKQLTGWSLPASWAMQQTLQRLTPSFGLSKVPEFHMLQVDHPIALTIGITRPRIYVSQWFHDHLDEVELEQVLAHELAHVSRSDNLIALVSTAFLGATAFLPSSWSAFHYLLRERELATDELAIAVTGKPMALARGLLKVIAPNSPLSTPSSSSSPPSPPPIAAAGLLEASMVEERVENLVRLRKNGPKPIKLLGEKIYLLGLTVLSPFFLAWLVLELPHLLNLP
jgi:Zn-dependent protease with chaperone function